MRSVWVGVATGAVMICCSGSDDAPATPSSSSVNDGGTSETGTTGAPVVPVNVGLITPTSLRVRADNDFGVSKQDEKTPTALPFSESHSLLDEEVGTGAKSTSKATYDFDTDSTGATFSITAEQDFTVGSHNAIAEGSIIFTVDGNARVTVKGNLDGTSTDGADHAYQQRTFLRRFGDPFETFYLEDETTRGPTAALSVNQSNDTQNGGTYNQSGAATVTVGKGTYELEYELEGRDDARPFTGTSKVTGTLTIRVEGAP